MSFDEPLSQEEEEKLIEEIAQYIHSKRLEMPAILFLESSKPLSSIGGTMGRMFVFPFLPILGDQGDLYGQKMIKLIENRDNIEKLIQKIEEYRK